MIVDLRLLSSFFGSIIVGSWLRVGRCLKLVVLWLIVLRLVIILGLLLIVRLSDIKVISFVLLSVRLEHIIVVFFIGISVILIIVRTVFLFLWKTSPWDVLLTNWLVTEAIGVAIIADVVADLLLLGQTSIVLNRLGFVTAVDEDRRRVLNVHISREVLEDLLSSFRASVDVAKLDVLLVFPSFSLNAVPLIGKLVTARARW